MIGWKAWCALVLGTGLGAGGAVAVQQKAADKTRASAIKAKARPTRPATSPSRASLPDCPLPSGLALPDYLLALPVLPSSPMFLDAPPRLPGGAAAGGGLTPPPPPAAIAPKPPAGAVPEPAAWAMLVAGLGLVGLSLRRTRMA